MYHYPSFIDSHLHFLGMGYQASILNLSQYPSIQNLIKDLKMVIEPPYLIGRGWNQMVFQEQRMLHKHDLNQISTSIPIALIRQCGHVICVNDAMLDYCHITPSTVSKGLIDYEAGILAEDALDLVYHRLPSPSKETLLRYLEKADRLCLENGITSVASDDLIQFHLPYSFLIDTIIEGYHTGRLHVKITEQVHIRSIKTLEELIQNQAFSLKHPKFSMGPIKLIADGSLGGKTAALMDGYAHDPHQHGILYFTDEDLFDIVYLADRHGIDVVIHAIGDQAAHQAINAITKSLDRTKRSNHHHAIIHAQVVQPEDLKQMVLYHIGAIIQPIFLKSDIAMAKERLGNRINDAYRFLTYYKKNLHVGFSTDCPIETVNPFENIACAMSQTSLINQDVILHSDERFTLTEALDCYLNHNRWFVNHSSEQDWIITDRQLETTNVWDLSNVTVLETIIDGVTCYRKNK